MGSTVEQRALFDSFTGSVSQHALDKGILRTRLHKPVHHHTLHVKVIAHNAENVVGADIGDREAGR